MDIFEIIKTIVGCDYISELRRPPYCARTKALLKVMELDAYSTSALNDVAQYFYGKQFAAREEVLEFLRS